MAFKVYNLKKVTMVLADIPIKEGLGDSDVLEITWEGDQFTDEVGGEGEVCRSQTNETRGTANLTLMNSSSHHQQLSALLVADVVAGNGAGVGSLFVKDNNGATLMMAPQCWIAKAPDLTIAKERGQSTWKFRFVSTPAMMLQGGN